MKTYLKQVLGYVNPHPFIIFGKADPYGSAFLVIYKKDK